MLNTPTGERRNKSRTTGQMRNAPPVEDRGAAEPSKKKVYITKKNISNQQQKPILGWWLRCAGGFGFKSPPTAGQHLFRNHSQQVRQLQPLSQVHLQPAKSWKVWCVLSCSQNGNDVEGGLISNLTPLLECSKVHLQPVNAGKFGVSSPIPNMGMTLRVDAFLPKLITKPE